MKVNGNKVKKFTLLMALLAPMIYLFGTLFEALKGSSGNVVLSQGETSYVDMSVTLNNDVYKRVMYYPDITPVSATFALSDSSYYVYFGDGVYYTTSPSSVTATNLSPVNDFDGYRFYLRCFVSSGRIGYSSLLASDECFCFSLSDYRYFEMFGTSVSYLGTNETSFSVREDVAYIYSNAEPLSFTYLFSGNSNIDLVRRIPVLQPTVVVPASENLSDYLFSQFFASDNFLAVSGRKVIDGTPDYGFEPAADLIRFVDGNMFHLVNVEYGPIVIGYIYYAFHVVCVFLIFNLLMFFPHLIENVYEKFERGW